LQEGFDFQAQGFSRRDFRFDKRETRGGATWRGAGDGKAEFGESGGVDQAGSGDLGGDVGVDLTGGDRRDHFGRQSSGQGGEFAGVQSEGEGFLKERRDAGGLCAARLAIEADDKKVLTGEAVKLATQPESNSTRTLAMSTLGERMGRPTARTSRTGEAAKVRTMSRS